MSGSVGAVLKPAGFANAKGIYTTAYLKDPTDPQWKDDPAYHEWLKWMDKYYPGGDKSSAFNVFGYSVAQTMIHVLKACGDDLTRANIMKQAANMDHTLPMLLPGIRVKTSPTDFAPIEDEQIYQFDGEKYVPRGDVIMAH